VVNLRLKGASIYWKETTANDMLLLRCLYKANRWQTFEIKELTTVLKAMIDSADLKEMAKQPHHDSLTVSIHSFSYRKGIPHDFTGNGGGHVFDCRMLPNPGKEPQYQNLTGCDQEVKNYLNDQSETELFLNNVKEIVSQSVVCYLDRDFNNLMVSFGCTGGQHRSVYCAEHIAAFLRKHFSDVCVLVFHHEQKHLNNRI